MKYCVLPVLFLAVLCKKGDDFVILPLVLPAEHLEIQFNGEALADPPEAVLTEALTSAESRESVVVSDGCLLSHRTALYGRERGFKFKICVPEIASLKQALEEGKSAAQGRLEIREGSRAQTIASLGKVDLLFRTRSQVALDADQEQLSGSVEPTDLPATFPDAMPVTAVNGDEVAFVYNSGERFLLLRLRDSRIAQRFAGALHRARGLSERLLESSADVFVSEIYFSSQGKPFVELSSDADGVVNVLLVSDLGHTASLRGAAFADAALLPDLPFKARIDLVTPAGTASITESQASVGAGRSHSRTSEFPGTRGSLLASILCGNAADLPACHSKGIAPGQWTHSPALAEDSRFCRPEDIALRELNPFGLETNGALNPAGKFIEFEILRTCESGRISIFAPLEIDAGSQVFAAGSRVVFAADSQFYETQVTENSRLRSLAVDRPVQILSLATRTLHTVFAGFPPDDLWIPRSKGRVHSLIIEEDQIVFHSPAASGLRPDAAGFMSPGTFIRANRGTARLNELYPSGSYDSASIPQDEFFETTGEEGSGRLTLEVLRLRDSKRVLHHFPPSGGLNAYFTQQPVCFDVPWTKASLFLPNEGALYTLRDFDGTILDEVEISPSLYSAMEKDRRSLAKPWALSPPGGRCVKSAASPANANPAVLP